MTRSDHSVDDALSVLASWDSTPGELSRRRFLQLLGMGVGAGLGGTAFVESLGAFSPEFASMAEAASPVGPDDGVLVIVGMFGGNDASNTVVHHRNGHYYDQRGSLAIPGNATLRLDGDTGLNAELATLKRFWDRDQLAVVEGLGYPDPDFSHFTSLAVWMSGVRHGVRPTGWIGRWLDEEYGTSPDPFGAATVGNSLPLHLRGRHQQASSIAHAGFDFGGSIESWDLRMHSAIERMARPAGRGALHDRFTATLRDQIDIGARVQPFMPAEADETEIVAKMRVAARLVNADIGLRVVDVGWHNFDQHADQPDKHPGLLRDFDRAIKTFFGELAPAWANRVTVMTYSEFGRTPFRNDANGTDHGSAGTAFVMGSNVKGGRYGQAPNLAGLSRWERPDHTVDFRSYYASVLDGWLGAGSSSVLGGGYEDLGLFERRPGAGNERPPIIGPTPPPAPTGRFVPMTPARILDSRYGTGSVIHRRMDDSEVIRVPVAGHGGVPRAGVTAVIANVTAVEASVPTYFTVWPAGERRPEASTLNPKVGGVVANCAVLALGDGGAVEVLNRFGNCHIIIDVFGYLVADAGGRLTAVQPERLLDTRTGQGGVSGKVGRRRRIDLRVAGRGGVPKKGATAVVLNVTVTEPESPGYIVSGASGRQLPETSNVNFAAGDTVPNLVVCEVGADGQVSLGAECHATHVVADVFGWLGPDGDGMIRPVTPHRVLDTRIGLGGPQRRLGAIHFVRLQLTNRRPLPSSATAVLLNVTATNASRDLFVTVWPSGRAMPNTSNLNMRGGDTVANLVLCELGPDGQVDLASPVSHVDVIADVVGYVGA